MKEITAEMDTTRTTNVLAIGNTNRRRLEQNYDMANFEADRTSYLGLLLIGVETPKEKLVKLTEAQRTKAYKDFWDCREAESNYRRLLKYLLYLHRDYVQKNKC